MDLFSFSFQVIILQKVNSEEVERHVTHEQLIVGEETDKRMKVNGRQAVPKDFTSSSFSSIIISSSSLLLFPFIFLFLRNSQVAQFPLE